MLLTETIVAYTALTWSRLRHGYVVHVRKLGCAAGRGATFAIFRRAKLQLAPDEPTAERDLFGVGWGNDSEFPNGSNRGDTKP